MRAPAPSRVGDVPSRLIEHTMVEGFQANPDVLRFHVHLPMRKSLSAAFRRHCLYIKGQARHWPFGRRRARRKTGCGPPIPYRRIARPAPYITSRSRRQPLRRRSGRLRGSRSAGPGPWRSERSASRQVHVVARHDHLGAFRQHHFARHVGRAEVELRTVVGEERRVTAALVLRQDVDLGLEVRVRLDRAGLART